MNTLCTNELICNSHNEVKVKVYNDLYNLNKNVT